MMHSPLVTMPVMACNIHKISVCVCSWEWVGQYVWVNVRFGRPVTEGKRHLNSPQFSIHGQNNQDRTHTLPDSTHPLLCHASRGVHRVVAGGVQATGVRSSEGDAQHHRSLPLWPPSLHGARSAQHGETKPWFVFVKGSELWNGPTYRFPAITFLLFPGLMPMCLFGLFNIAKHWWVHTLMCVGLAMYVLFSFPLVICNGLSSVFPPITFLLDWCWFEVPSLLFLILPEADGCLMCVSSAVYVLVPFH